MKDLKLLIDNRLVTMSNDVTGLLGGISVRWMPALEPYRDNALALRKKLDNARAKQSELNIKWSTILLDTEYSMNTFAKQQPSKTEICVFSDDLKSRLQDCLDKKIALVKEIDDIYEEWIDFNGRLKAFYVQHGLEHT